MDPARLAFIATVQKLALSTLWRSGHLTELQKVGLLEKLKRSREGQEERSLVGGGGGEGRGGTSEKRRGML